VSILISYKFAIVSSSEKCVVAFCHFLDQTWFFLLYFSLLLSPPSVPSSYGRGSAAFVCSWPQIHPQFDIEDDPFSDFAQLSVKKEVIMIGQPETLLLTLLLYLLSQVSSLVTHQLRLSRDLYHSRFITSGIIHICP
jgi:hypothetical protein